MADTVETPPPAEEAASEPIARRSLGADVAVTYASKLGVMVLTLGMAVLVARALGPSGRGLVSVAVAMTLTLVQVGSFGLVTANPYFAARDRASVDRLITNSLWFAAGLGVILIVVGALFKAEFTGATRGLDWPETIAALIAIPVALASMLLNSLLLGQGRAIAYNASEAVHVVLVFAALAVGLIFLDFGVLATLFTFCGGYVAGTVVTIVFLRGYRPSARPDRGLAWEMLKYGMRVYVATVLAFLVIRLDIFLVNGYLGSVEAGFYSVAAALAEGVYLLPTVVGLNLFPRVARGAGVEATASVFRIMFVIYGVLCLISVPLAAPGIRLAFGADFSSSATLYYWLVPGVFSLGMLTILSNHFAGRGFPLEAALIWVGGLAVNLAINLIFLPGNGTYIASLSSSISYGILLFLHMHLFAREAGGYRALYPSIPETVGFLRGLIRSLSPQT